LCNGRHRRSMESGYAVALYFNSVDSANDAWVCTGVGVSVGSRMSSAMRNRLIQLISICCVVGGADGADGGKVGDSDTSESARFCGSLATSDVASDDVDGKVKIIVSSMASRKKKMATKFKQTKSELVRCTSDDGRTA